MALVQNRKCAACGERRPMIVDNSRTRDVCRDCRRIERERALEAARAEWELVTGPGSMLDTTQVQLAVLRELLRVDELRFIRACVRFAKDFRRERGDFGYAEGGGE